MSTPPTALQLRLREHQLFLVLSIVVGVLAGLSAVLFTVAIDQTSYRLFGLAPSRARLFAVPPLVSLVTGFLLVKFFPDVRGSGVPQTEAAYRLAGGAIPARVPVGKFITGVLCIGSGHSMGREGPSVQIGAGLASVIGRWLRLPPRRIRELVPVGAAGALAAAFNTPVAAVLFALEEIIGDMNAALLGSAVVASVASVVVERSILGNEPLFHVPPYRLVHPAELLAYAALGIIGGLISLLFCEGAARPSRIVPAVAHTFSRAAAGHRRGSHRGGSRLFPGDHGRRVRIRGPGAQWRSRAEDDGGLVLPQAGRTIVSMRPETPAVSSGRASISARWREAPPASSSAKLLPFPPATLALTRWSAWGPYLRASSERR